MNIRRIKIWGGILATIFLGSIFFFGIKGSAMGYFCDTQPDGSIVCDLGGGEGQTVCTPCDACSEVCVNGVCTPAPGYDCAAGGGGFEFPTCGAGTSLSCVSPMDFFCGGNSSCAAAFPSKRFGTMACYATDSETGAQVPGVACQTNCNCCAAGYENSCAAGTYTKTYNYTFGTNNGAEGRTPAQISQCNTTEDAYISGADQLPCVDNCDPGPGADCFRTCTRVNTCRTCGCVPVCSNVAPSQPVIATPANGAELTVGVPVTVNWPDIASWGTACTNPYNRYMACISSDDVNCDLVGNWDLGLTSQYTWTPKKADPTVYMFAAANNGALTTWSNRTTDVCVEAMAPTVSTWSGWPATPTYCGNVTRTRTCSEVCGTDDCSAYFASKVGCDVAANCTYVGNTQTETRCNECGPTTVYGACNPATQTKPLVSCTENCGTNDCAAVPLTIPACCASNPTVPNLISPADGTEVTLGANVTLDWSDVSWGFACPANANQYNVCLDDNQSGCSYGYPSSGTTSQYSQVAAVTGNVYWAVIASNGGLESWSATRRVCVEGFNIADPAYLTAWSSCGANHKRTRTCIEDCGTNNCSGVSVVEDCIGTITGSLFDASDYTDCSSIAMEDKYKNQTFGITGTWPVISTPVSTDSVGNYSESVYASAVNPLYTYSYTDLINSGLAAGVKFNCQSAAVSVSNQAQTVTKDTGFWRVYGGWWQAVGGSVYGDDGIRSEIPSSILTEMSLILPDATAGNRRGLLSYGVTRPAGMLGTNPNAKVSNTGGVGSLGWEKESKYGGQIYDWGFFNTRFNIFTKTAWADGQPVVYSATDTTNGYKILKTDASVNSFGYSPEVGQFVIFHVNGDVRVTSNISVPDGAFLAVIAKGTITFDPGTGVLNPGVTSADGWYVADNISVPCRDVDSNGCDKTDSQFLGNGSFVGWNGISLGRNLGVTNNTIPSEKFTYRQDLLLNAPKPMKFYLKYYKPFVP